MEILRRAVLNKVSMVSGPLVDGGGRVTGDVKVRVVYWKLLANLYLNRQIF